MKNAIAVKPTATLPSLRIGRPAARFAIVVLVLLLAGAAASWVRANATMRSAPLVEVTLVARDMAFYLPGDPRPNPTLTFERGERVRLVLRNQDPGMEHDFVARGLGLSTELLRQTGTETALEFRLPEETGSHEYLCSTHAAMMRGRLVVN